jgi:hypothetical protein
MLHHALQYKKDGGFFILLKLCQLLRQLVPWGIPAEVTTSSPWMPVTPV